MDDVIRRWNQQERDEFIDSFFRSLSEKLNSYSSRLIVHHFSEAFERIIPFCVWVDDEQIVGSYDLYFSQVGAPNVDTGFTTIMQFGGGFFDRVNNIDFASPAAAAEKLARKVSIISASRAIILLSKKAVRRDVSWSEVGF